MSKTAALFWYSQTGHSYACGLKARDALESDAWKVSVVPMKYATPADFQADILLYAFPVHSFQVPVMVNHLCQSSCLIGSQSVHGVDQYCLDTRLSTMAVTVIYNRIQKTLGFSRAGAGGNDRR